jgi:hypothetical protein
VAKVVFAAWIFATWPLPPATWIAVGKGFADYNPAFADCNPAFAVPLPTAFSSRQRRRIQ